MIYHTLFFVFLGPMAIMIFICFDNTYYLKNTAFIPVCSRKWPLWIFFMAQLMLYMCWAMTVYFHVMDYLM